MFFRLALATKTMKKWEQKKRERAAGRKGPGKCKRGRGQGKGRAGRAWGDNIIPRDGGQGREIAEKGMEK